MQMYIVVPQTKRANNTCGVYKLRHPLFTVCDRACRRTTEI